MNDENRLLANELARNLAGLKDGRDEALRGLGETQIALHSLLRQEAVRQRSRGREDRALALEARAASSVAVIGRLETERQRLRIVVPEVPEGGALIHGRVRDPSGRGLPGLTVCLLDSRNQALPGIPSPTTDENGYYAIILSPPDRPDPGRPEKRRPDQGRPGQGSRATLAVFSASGRLLHREKQPLDLDPGSRHVVDVTLDPRGLAGTKGGGRKGGKPGPAKTPGGATGADEGASAGAKRKRPRRS